MPKGMGSQASSALEGKRLRSRQESCKTGSRPMSSRQAAEGQAAHAHSPPGLSIGTLTAEQGLSTPPHPKVGRGRRQRRQ